MDAFDAATPPSRAQADPDGEERRLQLAHMAARERTRRTRWIVVGVVVALVGLGWFFRWQVSPVAGRNDRPGGAVVVDRLTGDFFYIEQDMRMQVQDAK